MRIPDGAFEEWLREVRLMRDLPEISPETMGLLREAFAGGYLCAGSLLVPLSRSEEP